MAKHLPFETQLARLCLGVSVPLFIALLAVMWVSQISIWAIFLTGIFGTLSIAWTTATIKQKVAHQIRTQTNFLDALIAGDFTMRARESVHEHELTPLHSAVNQISERMSQQRWQSLESQRLVEMILDNIDVAIFALDDKGEIRLSNQAADALLSQSTQQTPEKQPDPLASIQQLKDGERTLLPIHLAGVEKKFHVHKVAFREQGHVYSLVFVANVHELLQMQERNAWQRLIRILSHEINNSLSPIASISDTLKKLSAKQPESKFNQQLDHSLSIIAKRARGLAEFTNGYNQLAKLPAPKPCQVDLKHLITNSAALVPELKVHMQDVQWPRLRIDEKQFEQVLINLFKNAQQATLGHQAEVFISFTLGTQTFVLTLTDNGQGLSNTHDLFVPFYTTKPQGSGIGLIVCQQLIEGHQGRISLSNRENNDGCCVTIELPMECVFEAK